MTAAGVHDAGTTYLMPLISIRAQEFMTLKNILFWRRWQLIAQGPPRVILGVIVFMDAPARLQKLTSGH